MRLIELSRSLLSIPSVGGRSLSDLRDSELADLGLIRRPLHERNFHAPVELSNDRS